jgi:hypothetical protein
MAQVEMVVAVPMVPMRWFCLMSIFVSMLVV